MQTSRIIQAIVLEYTSHVEAHDDLQCPNARPHSHHPRAIYCIWDSRRCRRKNHLQGRAGAGFPQIMTQLTFPNCLCSNGSAGTSVGEFSLNFQQSSE